MWLDSTDPGTWSLLKELSWWAEATLIPPVGELALKVPQVLQDPEADLDPPAPEALTALMEPQEPQAQRAQPVPPVPPAQLARTVRPDPLARTVRLVPLVRQVLPVPQATRAPVVAVDWLL